MPRCTRESPIACTDTLQGDVQSAHPTFFAENVRSECRSVHETLQARVEPTRIPEVAKAWAHIDVPCRQERVLRVRPCNAKALHCFVRERFANHPRMLPFQQGFLNGLIAYLRAQPESLPFCPRLSISWIFRHSRRDLLVTSHPYLLNSLLNGISGKASRH